MTRSANEANDDASREGRIDADDRPEDETPGEEPASPAEDAASEVDAPVSEEDALRALRKGGGDEAESALAASIALQVAKRIQIDPTVPRIGTLALFNESVSFGGGFNLAGGALGAGAVTGGLRRIPEDELASSVEFYLHPPGFGNALKVLRERHLLVMPSKQGTGREATAYNLLAEALAMCPGDDAGNCYLVTESSAIGALGWEPHHHKSGYLAVLDGGAGTTLSMRPGLTMDAIDERWITQTAAKVKAACSFMVLVTDPARGALVEAASRSEHVLPELDMIDPVRIVERRVLGHEPEPERIEELRNSLVAAGALDLLRERPEPRLAVNLAEVIRSGGDLASRVRTFRDPTIQVHAWFGRHREPEAVCFAIAAATLGGSSYLTVSDAAVELWRLLFRNADRYPDLRFGDRLGSEHPWIVVSVPGDDDDYPAMAGPARVRFRNPLIAQAVLAYAWTYLDGRRPAIQAWLRRLVEHPKADVRAHAAVAAGVIAWSDHDHALHRYLRPWAGSPTPVVRQAAATALEVVGGHPDLTAPIWTLLESWASEEKVSVYGRRRSVTAVMAVGGTLGGTQPQRATTLLQKMLNGKDWGVLLPVAWSLVHLIEQDRISEVLSVLLDWSQAQDSTPLVTKALSAFVFAVSQPGPETADGAGEDWAGTRSPRLPLVMAHARDYQSQLEELWARALARKPAQTQALEALRECLGSYANGEGAVLSDIQDILLGVAARRGRHRERLEFHLGQWAREGGSASDPAATIYAALMGVKR